MHRTWLIGRWVLLAVTLTYGGIVVYAYPHDHQAHIDQSIVAGIEAKRLTEADVDGSDLPSEPDPSQVNATVAGVDANDNGIRDDVELTIFSRYPTSTTIRAAELQYALDLQTQLTQVNDQATWMASEIQRVRGFGCLYDASDGNYQPLEDEVEALVMNTPQRKQQYDSIQQYGVSYKLSSGPDCDVSR